MAEAIIRGILKSGTFSAHDVIISDKDGKRLAHIAENFGARIAKGNSHAVEESDIVLLAVKPQSKPEVLREITKTSIAGKLFISIAAGISLRFLEKKLPGSRVIRVMPNNPCLVGCGMSVICRGSDATDSDMAQARGIFSPLGDTMEIGEELMDAVTGLSGSGPAFVYSAVQGMIKGGETCGLSHADSKRLAIQTFLGAAATLKETGRPAAELIEMVSSPGGTTIEGLKILEKQKFEESMAGAVAAAAKRAGEIRAEYEEGSL